VTFTTKDITEAFALLRDLCDPRGHDLLEVLEAVVLTERASLNLLSRTMDEFLDVHTVSAISDYSRKV